MFKQNKGLNKRVAVSKSWMYCFLLIMAFNILGCDAVDGVNVLKNSDFSDYSKDSVGPLWLNELLGEYTINLIDFLEFQSLGQAYGLESRQIGPQFLQISQNQIQEWDFHSLSQLSRHFAITLQDLPEIWNIEEIQNNKLLILKNFRISQKISPIQNNSQIRVIIKHIINADTQILAFPEQQGTVGVVYHDGSSNPFSFVYGFQLDMENPEQVETKTITAQKDSVNGGDSFNMEYRESVFQTVFSASHQQEEIEDYYFSIDGTFILQSISLQIFPPIEFCQEQEFDVCENCVGGYVESEDKLVCYAEIMNCVDQQNDKCEECADSYTESEDQTQCFSEIDFCVDQEDEECLQCVEGYTSSPVGDECFEQIQFCVDQVAADDCDECESGYFVSADETFCIEVIPQCVDQVEEVCNKCEENLVLGTLKNRCVATLANCLVQEDEKCVLCNKGSNLNYEENRCIQRVTFCADYNSLADACERCIPNKSLVNGQCVNGIENCVEFSEDGLRCVECTEGFEGDGCQESAEPCDQNQFRDANGDCQDTEFENCGQFDEGGVCLQCEEGFRFNFELTECQLVSGPEVECPQNTEEFQFVIVDGVCQQYDINCVEFGPNGLCQVCRDEEGQRFYKLNNRCIRLSITEENLTRN